ncbi:MAG: NAD-dependent epimerase/dehydratase family protein [Bacteroidetes bacterium]|nr:NAD-dependent epimerase/dehydratase family protein [Bacteroidota bacterium]
MNLLITGIHGFVGSNLVAALKAQHTIYGLDIVSPQKEGVVSSFGWNDLEQIPSVDAVIHLAGKAHDIRNTVSKQEYFDINLGLTQKIFDYFLQSDARKFIFFSSVKAVADQLDGDILTEDVVPSPKGPYGESKLAAENYILNCFPSPNSQLRTPNSELRTLYILRPCMIHGPGNKGNLNLLYKMVSKRIPWPLGKFDNQRSFCSIDNLNMIIRELIHRDNIPSGVYNICDDESISTNDIIRLIAESQNRKALIWNVSHKLIRTISKVGDVFHLPLNSERLQKLTESYVVSNEKIINTLGKPLPVSSKEGLLKTFESFNKL